MSNIQKSFKNKAKRGLCMAVGGVLGEEDPYKGMSAATAAQYTNDPDVLNNANTAKWAAEEAQRQRSHPGQAFLNPVATQAPMTTFAKPLGDSVGDSLFSRFGSSTSPAAPAPSYPPKTTFQQDTDARQSRTNGLRKSLGGFADGGVVGNDGLTDAQRAKLSGARSNLGVSNAAPAPAPAAPAPAPAAPASAQQAPSIGGAINSIRERQRMLNNLATGGVVGAKTFEFEGKGTGTSDDIPVKVAGNHINVSDGEKAVVLPAKTAQNPQALDMIEDIIQQSNGGRAPNRGLRNGGSYANGVVEGPMPLLDDEVRARSAANLAARGRAPGPTVTPTHGGAVMNPMIAPMEMPTTPATAAAEQPGVLRRGINWAAGKAGFAPAAGATGAAQAATAAPAAPPSAAFSAGKQLASAYRDLPVKPSNPIIGAMAVAPEALLNERKNAFLNDPNVAWTDKARMTGKDVVRYGLSAAGGVLGMPVGQAAIPVPGVGALAGGLAGAAIGNAGGEWVGDKLLGDPMKGYKGEGWNLPKGEAAPQDVASDPQAQPVGLPTPAQAYPTSVPGGRAAPEAATVAPGTRTIRTANGDVTATRDKRGQLVVTSGNADDPDAETKRATEATRMRADMARQVDNFEKMRIDSDLSSNSAGDRQRGALRQGVRTANQQAEIEKAKAANEASWKQSDLDIRKEGLSLKREAAQREMEQKRFENEDKANEGAIKRDEALTKRLASRFVTKDAKGNQTPNTEAAADFLSHADATVAEMEKKTRGTPEHSRWFNRNTGKPKGAGDLGTTDLDMLTGLYDVKRRFRDSAGSLPGYADKGDSLDLMDYAGTINGEHVEFPRLSAKQKRSIRAQKKDFDFEDGPIGAMDFTTSRTGTPTDRYTRHFTQGK